MAFSPLGYMLASAMTRDMPDRNRAVAIDMFGGLMGTNLPGVILLATMANQGQGGSPVGVTPHPPRVGGPTPTVVLPTRVQVPELPDDADSAERLLESRGLRPILVEVASDDPQGVVIGSDPAAGSIVPMGTTVAVEVSAGVPVPDVTGRKQDEAVRMLEDAGFHQHEIKQADKPGPAGTVLVEEPGGGTYQDVSTTIVLSIAQGPKGIPAPKSG
jgi:hypothetical protein